MKKNVLPACVLVILWLAACRKQATYNAPGTLSVESAKDFFTLQVVGGTGETPTTENAIFQPRKNLPRHPLWNQARVINLPTGKAVIAPVKYDVPSCVKTSFSGSHLLDLNQLSRLLIYAGPAGQLRAELITYFPDSVYFNRQSHAFTGIVLVEDWQGHTKAKFKYESNGTVEKEVSSDSTIAARTSLVVCYTIEGYNYSVSDPDDVYYWSEPAGCSYYSFDQGTSGGSSNTLNGSIYGSPLGGGSLNVSSASYPMIYRGNSPIADPRQYTRCFNANPASTYTVTLYIDQPVAGHRNTYSSSPAINVGHVFLTFQQNSGGVIIRRAMGLYPSGTVSPVTPASPASLNDDEGHGFDVSLTITVTGQQFFNMLNYCANGNAVSYNLNSNNCATWALSSLAAGGVSIAAHTGNWPFGSGYDPGDLGEDVRNMTLAPGMARNTQGGYALSNLGICQ